MTTYMVMRQNAPIGTADFFAGPPNEKHTVEWVDYEQAGRFTAEAAAWMVTKAGPRVACRVVSVLEALNLVMPRDTTMPTHANLAAMAMQGLLAAAGGKMEIHFVVQHSHAIADAMMEERRERRMRR